MNKEDLIILKKLCQEEFDYKKRHAFETYGRNGFDLKTTIDFVKRDEDVLEKQLKEIDVLLKSEEFNEQLFSLVSNNEEKKEKQGD